ncbi:GNAT family N-acetyltransferase [Geomesophilobacter sediminis]|uniref:GNAT family N-acetyltransferase n=1 Tax=Geomesophilobacter sediminis TaxID=2798584 RepID=A0A8J7LVM2_9BACT|nr:GNAT family N-acetyltransferase [Geomesophilobacter sediminis]MBJ6725185.1 GNAT family N-acetyltransferase [Geomesophilobacter sediminis]
MEIIDEEARGTFDRFAVDDIDPVLEELGAVGTVLDRWELEFLLERFPEGCLVYRELGRPVGWCFSIRYGRSGWIANLYLAPRWRGRGIGLELARRALQALRGAGVENIWLTASEAGRPIYERLGFLPVDTVNSWVGFGADGERRAPHRRATPAMLDLDQAGWGEPKAPAIAELVRRGSLFEEKDGFVTAQEWKGLVRVGPWACREWLTAWGLLDAVLALAGRARPVLVHAPVGNSAAAALLFMHHFRVVENHLLMCCGDPSAYDPTFIFSLALGSIG